MTDQEKRDRLNSFVFYALAGTIAIIRLNYCVSLPVNSGDLVRLLLYGTAATRLGPGVAAVPLVQFYPQMQRVAFAGQAYPYPFLPLLFYTLIASIYPTLFTAKLALTVVEAYNSFAIGRLLQNRWFGLIYWVSPVSLWWASREGQFEGLQNAFVLTAFLCMSARQFSVAVLALVLAVQTKLSAALLLPVFFYRIHAEGGSLFKAGIALIAGMIPTFAGAFYYPFGHWLGVKALYINPFYWNFLDSSIFVWTFPGILAVRILNQVGTYGILALLIYRAFREKDFSGYFAPIMFLLVCKIHTNVLFWYMLVFPSLVPAIRSLTSRRLFLALSPFLDFYSLLEVIKGPFGYTRGYVGPPSAFDVFPLPTGHL